MTNKEFYDKLSALIDNAVIYYGEKNVPGDYVKMKIGGRLVGLPVEESTFFNDMLEKIEEKEFFSEPALTRHLARSSSYINYEVKRGTYARLVANRFKLYIVKDW